MQKMFFFLPQMCAAWYEAPHYFMDLVSLWSLISFVYVQLIFPSVPGRACNTCPGIALTELNEHLFESWMAAWFDNAHSRWQTRRKFWLSCPSFFSLSLSTSNYAIDYLSKVICSWKNWTSEQADWWPFTLKWHLNILHQNSWCPGKNSRSSAHW